MTDYEQAYRTLRAGVEALADEWSSKDAYAEVDQDFTDDPLGCCSDALRALLASSAPATASDAVEGPTELARNSASEGATEEIAELVEASSLGAPEAQALRATVSDEHAARIVARSKELEAESTGVTSSDGDLGLSDLIEALRDAQHRRCAYGTRDGDGRTCDCKYDMRPLRRATSETTGCPELRAAIRALEATRNE